MPTTGNVNGTDIGVYIGGQLVGGAKSHTLNLGHAARDATTKGSAGWEESLEGLRNWSISGDGLVAYDEVNLKFSDLFATFSGRTKVVLKFSTEETGDNRYTGDAYVESIDKTAPVEDTTTYSFSFKGTGVLAEEAIT